MAKERIIWIDALKGWLIILVIMGHSIGNEGIIMSNINRMASSFLMPAFMAVSGWLFYSQNYNSLGKVNNSKSFIDGLIRRSRQLVIPYLIWSILVFLVRGDYSSSALFDIVYYPDKYFWFLLVLFGIVVIFSGTQKLSLKLNLDETILIGLTSIILLSIMVLMELRVFGFQFLAYYFIFYSIGYCLHKYEDRLKYLHNPWILFVLFCVWLVLAWFWEMHELPSWIPKLPYLPQSIIQYLYRGITGFLAVVIILSTSPYILNGNNKFNRQICLIGDISLGLYVAHSAIVVYVQNSVHSRTDNVYINIVTIFTLTFILSLLMVLILRKNKYTEKIFLGKL